MASQLLRLIALVLLWSTVSPAAAQIQNRPTDPPVVTAANESWYQLREPIQFAGELYFRAGAAVFFDGNVMVRSGYYNGIPLYMDSTIEPYSVVLVPVRPGLMQPYEKLRRGDLAGTTGSRTPSFPVRATANAFAIPAASTAPTELSRPIGAVPVSELVAPARPTGGVPVADIQISPPPPRALPTVSATTPESNDGVWIHYQGRKWVSAGAAVPLRATEFRVVGQYEGFPVFVRKDDSNTIYLPTRAGLVAPYRGR
jgi:hypothetical protein